MENKGGRTNIFNRTNLLKTNIPQYSNLISSPLMLGRTRQLQYDMNFFNPVLRYSLNSDNYILTDYAFFFNMAQGDKVTQSR